MVDMRETYYSQLQHTALLWSLITILDSFFIGLVFFLPFAPVKIKSMGMAGSDWQKTKDCNH